MNILEEKKNPLLHRAELIITIESEVIPTKIEVLKQISEKTKKPEENIIIERINSDFGSKTFKVSALVYDTLESKEKYTTIPRKVLKKRAAEKKKEEEAKKKAAEEAKAVETKPTEETPKEEVKEEPKVEEKVEEIKEAVEETLTEPEKEVSAKEKVEEIKEAVEETLTEETEKKE